MTNPCLPSPCGPNSQCREVNGQAVCTCVQGYGGSPPLCRPECVVSSDCPSNKACSNQKCINPCLGSCGVEAKCVVVKHNPICTCPPKYTGDPFIRCTPFRKYYSSFHVSTKSYRATHITKNFYRRSSCCRCNTLYSVAMWTEFNLQRNGRNAVVYLHA